MNDSMKSCRISVEIPETEVTAFFKQLQEVQGTNYEMSKEAQRLLLFAELDGILDNYGIQNARIEVTLE